VSEVARFPDSYASSREHFRNLARSRANWLSEYPLPADSNSAATQPLTIDIAYLGPEKPDRLVLVTSGLHGVEGFFGGAVQHRLLEQWESAIEQPVGLLLVHALNPFGFAQRRRWNEANVDLNRNFLLPGEAFSGAPPRYAELNRLLNPARAPRACDPFLWLAAGKLARFGLSALQQAIAGGQYEYPQGLFFGGKGPSATQQLLDDHLRDWVKDAEQIVHLDFHTGLGPWATHKLLIEEPARAPGARWLQSIYGMEVVRSPHSDRTAYHARGGLGTWCQHYLTNRKYVYACAEFGTYRPLKVLAGLRKENQAYWYTPPDSAARRLAAARLQELFCPASNNWRGKVLDDGTRLVTQAIAALSGAG
jgi:predicted deacylase